MILVMENLNFLTSMLKGKHLAHYTYVLRIDVSEYLEGDHYFVEKTCFCHVSLPQAKFMICESGLLVEALVISSYLRFSAIEELRNETKKRSIPFILFSLKFEQHVKDMAIELRADDYQCGVLNLPLDYIGFMKRLKHFKCCLHRNKARHGLTVTAILRRCFDILGSTFLLLVLSPVMAVIAAIIKAGSDGPLFVLSQKAGYSYKVFDLYEFRTYTDQDANSLASRFGEFLYKSGLSKLPEIINVLKGDLSLIGEPPLSLNEAAKFTNDKIAMRLLSTPGLTGMWGLSKQSEMTHRLAS